MAPIPTARGLSGDEAPRPHTRQLHDRALCLVALGREDKRAAKWPQGKYSRRMHQILRLPWAQVRYALRKTVAERPFAEIKATMGFRRFALRGRSKVRGEWDLVCAAFNLKRLRAATEAV